jgi:hypothetical protein
MRKECEFLLGWLAVEFREKNVGFVHSFVPGQISQESKIGVSFAAHDIAAHIAVVDAQIVGI